MTTLFDNLFNTDAYRSVAERDRARLIYGFTLILMVLFLLYAVFAPQDEAGLTMLGRTATDFLSVVSIVGIVVVGVVTLVLTRMGRIDLSAYGPLLMWLLSGIPLGYQNHFVTADAGATLLMLVLIGSLFIRLRGLMIATGLALLVLLISVLTYTSSNGVTIDYGAYIGNSLALAFQVLGAAGLIYLFLRSARIDTLASSASAYEDRMRLATITTQIAQRIQRRTELNDLLNSAIADILQSYADIYHAQIFLIDETTNDAALAASTGSVGAMLLQRHHKLPVGSRSVIGQVTSTGQVIVARAELSDGVHRRNEFLPDTVVEAAFPLRLGDAVIGALDLQSRVAASFTETDLPVFQSLADNIAVAIDNARLFEETETRLRENQGLIEQMRGAVREVERLNRQLTRQAWTDYLGDQGGGLSLDVDFEHKVNQRSDVWTPTLDEAVRANRLVEKPLDDGTIVSLPLRVRSEVIGAMEFELDGEALTPEDVNLLQAVADRFGLAVENVRLYEETRQAADQEQRINDIAARFQSVATVDELLRITLTELSDTLGAEGGSIRLGRFAEPNGENAP